MSIFTDAAEAARGLGRSITAEHLVIKALVNKLSLTTADIASFDELDDDTRQRVIDLIT